MKDSSKKEEYAKELESLRAFISEKLIEREECKSQEKINILNTDLTLAYNRKYYLLKQLSK